MANPEESLEQASEAVIAEEAPPAPRPDTSRERPERRTETEDKTRKQPPYHVIIWNDEEHTYEYVIELLMKIFGHPLEMAYQITYEVDHVGRGIAWTGHQEVAELKRDQILAYGPDWRMAVSKGSIRATIEPAPG